MKKTQYKFHTDCNAIADDVLINGILLGCHHDITIKDVNFICKIFDKFIDKIK